MIAGVAFETKYTAFVSVSVIVLAALVWRRGLLGFAAVLMAAHVFCVWEFVIAVVSGRSHFFFNLAGGDTIEGGRLLDALLGLVKTKGPLFTSLLSLLGGIALPFLLLGMLALGLSRRWLLLTAAIFLGGVVAIGLFDTHFKGKFAPSARFFGAMQTPPLNFELADVIFAVFGGGVFVVLGFVARSLWRSSSGEGRREVVFLLGWLAFEIVAFFPLTPFPAVRRVLGIFIVLALLVGRCAAMNGVLSKHYRTVR